MRYAVYCRMAYIITSKTRRSESWRRGRKGDVMRQTKEVERHNDEKADDFQKKAVKKALESRDG